VTATLAWKGSASQLRAIVEHAANGADATLSAVNETNVQVTAYVPVTDIRDRARASAVFLDRLYDAAQSSGMGVSPAAPPER
jgi:hypothetical protein